MSPIDRVIDLSLYQSISRGRAVLEFGSGSGRIQLALRDIAETVVGIEQDARLVEKSRSHGLTIFHGDFRHAQVTQQFDVVLMPFNAIMEIGNRRGQIQAIQNAARHLGSGGQLVIESFRPIEELLKRGRVGPVTYQRGRFMVTERHAYDRKRQRIYYTYRLVGTIGDGNVLHHRVRWVEVAEYRQWLRQAGFTSIIFQAGFEGEPLTSEAFQLVVIANK